MIFGHDNTYRRIFRVRHQHSLFISALRLFCSFNIQDSECALEAVAKNERRSLHFNPSYISAIYEDVHPSFVAEG